MNRLVVLLVIGALAQSPACAGQDLMSPPGEGTVRPASEEKRIDQRSEVVGGEVKVKPESVADELLVTFQDGTDEARIDKINKSVDAQVIRKMHFGQTRICYIKIPKGQSIESIKLAYKSFPEVQSVEPNYKVRIQ